MEDSNTYGLGWDAYDSKDRFDELCLSFGQDTTSASSARGGSYGFGKGVYESASDCNMFIVYSVFEPSDELEAANERGAHARLFACATFDGHQVGATKYTGRALFGIHHDREIGFEPECRPLLDEDAHRAARQLGFEERTSIDTGTAIMIVGSRLDMHEFGKAVEDYWWPRIESDQLSVELKENDDVWSPDVRARHDLEPYIRCYSLIEEGVPKEKEEKEVTLNRVEGKRPGSLAMKPLPPLPADESDDEDEDGPDGPKLRNTIALIRSGPRMVVEYMGPGGRGSGDFAGVFVSHTDADKALHLSEPPSHDKWDHNSQRIDDYYKDDTERDAAKKLVKAVISRIQTQARQFQNGLNPPPPPQAMEGTRKLRNILARIMSSSGQGPIDPPPQTTDPFDLRIDESRENAPTHSKVAATVRIRLRDDAQMDNARVTMSIRPIVVIDDNMRREKSERIDLESVAIDGIHANVDDSFDVPLTIFRDRDVTVKAKSGAFGRDAYASLEVEVNRATSNRATSGSGRAAGTHEETPTL